MIYNIKNLYPAKIKKRSLLNKKESEKKTYHLILDIKGANINYEVGDCIGVQPINDPALVERTFSYLHTPENHLHNFLTSRANISKVSRSLLTLIGQNKKNRHIQTLLLPTHSPLLKNYINTHELWQVLKENDISHISCQQICSHLLPLTPRFYSIASSQKPNSDEIHLVVTMLSYTIKENLRKGVASNFLCNLAKEKKTLIPIFLRKSHHFSLPSDPSASIIMIGSGTGIAPFLGFMQERITTNSSGKNWLFFGERNKAHNFYFSDFLQKLEKENKLRLDLAFSRDQPEKVYVQHKLEKTKKEIWQWLLKGAYIYICGSAKRMAKDVHLTLINIIKEEGQLNEKEARTYLMTLRKKRRYLRDIY